MTLQEYRLIVYRPSGYWPKIHMTGQSTGQDGLSNKRRYPVEQFRAFWEAGKRYAELTKNDPLIHRNVVVAINRDRQSATRGGK